MFYATKMKINWKSPFSDSKMAANGLPAFPYFEAHASGVVSTRRDKNRPEQANIIYGPGDHTRKKASLFRYAGKDIFHVFDTISDRGEEDDF